LRHKAEVVRELHAFGQHALQHIRPQLGIVAELIAAAFRRLDYNPEILVVVLKGSIRYGACSLLAFAILLRGAPLVSATKVTMRLKGKLDVATGKLHNSAPTR